LKKTKRGGSCRSCRRLRERSEERAAKKHKKDYWKHVKRNGWGNKLHEFIKASVQNPTLNLRTPHNLVVPPVYRYNHRISMLRSKFKVEGKDPRLVIPAMNVSQYMSNGVVEVASQGVMEHGDCNSPRR
jgi:hypothetical protein